MPRVSNASRSEEPANRPTRLCQVAMDALEAAEESCEDDRAIVMVIGAGEGGVAMSGYGAEADATGDLLTYVKAICEANGQPFVFMPVSGN
jgi:hypothetical protein